MLTYITNSHLPISPFGLFKTIKNKKPVFQPYFSGMINKRFLIQRQRLTLKVKIHLNTKIILKKHSEYEQIFDQVKGVDANSSSRRWRSICFT